MTNNIPLRRQTPALPELMGDAAYRTAYVGKWHLGDELFAQHGFQEWISIEDGHNPYFYPEPDQNARSSYQAFLANLGYQPDAKGGHYSREFAVRRTIEHCKPAFLAGPRGRLCPLPSGRTMDPARELPRASHAVLRPSERPAHRRGSLDPG